MMATQTEDAHSQASPVRLALCAAAAAPRTPCGPLQILMMLIAGNLRLGNYETALSYIHDHGRPLSHNPCSGSGGFPLIADLTGPASKPHLPPHPLPLEVLLYSLRAHLGLGRAAEAAAVLARQLEPHPSCTFQVIRVGLPAYARARERPGADAPPSQARHALNILAFRYRKPQGPAYQSTPLLNCSRGGRHDGGFLAAWCPSQE
jgi:hypothetical protein